MAKYSNKSNRCHREKNTSRGNKGTFISCKTTTTRGRPREGVIYRLTGGSDTPSIARGDTWEESAMKPRQMGLFARRLSGADPGLTDLADELGEAHGYRRTTVFPSAGVKGGYVTTFEVPRGFPSAPRGAKTKILKALKKAGWKVKHPMEQRGPSSLSFGVILVPSATGRKARGRWYESPYIEDDVREIVDRHGYLYEARFIDDYSGRGMFGRTASLAVVIHPDEYEDVGPRSEMGQELVAQGLKFDRMGRRGWVYYT